MVLMSAAQLPEYFRRDQTHGITAPDLSKDCAHAEPVVRSRGKRTKFTSVSLDRDKIDDFGPSLYVALRPNLSADGHLVVEHISLMASLRNAAATGEKADRLKALQAIRYAERRREGLIDWKFDISSVQRKDLIRWPFSKVQKYFQRRSHG